MININLLPPKNILTQKQKELRSRLTAALIVSTVIFGGAFLIVILIGTYYSDRLTAADLQQANYSSQLAEVSQPGWDLFSVKTKLAGIAAARNREVDYGKLIQSIEKLVEGIGNLNNFTADSNGNVSFDLVVPNQAAMDKFLMAFSNRSSETSFLQEVSVSGLRTEDLKSYSFTFTGRYSLPKEQ